MSGVMRQLDRNEDYHLLEPVYSLNLVNDVFLSDVEEYYHYYRMVHEKHTDKVIDGLHLVFVELPKFTPHTMNEKKMQVLWLRYLTEIDGYMETVPQELLDNPEINKAMEVVEESAFSPEQLLGYDKFWDIIRTETTLYNSGVRQGREEGREDYIVAENDDVLLICRKADEQKIRQFVNDVSVKFNGKYI